jgi:hypothetical protein
MLTWENCVEAQALRTKGWSISASANHLGHDRKTIRANLNGERRPGERRPARAEAMEDFLGYCRQRLADDPHLWSTTFFPSMFEVRPRLPRVSRRVPCLPTRRLAGRYGPGLNALAPGGQAPSLPATRGDHAGVKVHRADVGPLVEVLRDVQ